VPHVESCAPRNDDLLGEAAVDARRHAQDAREWLLRACQSCPQLVVQQLPGSGDWCALIRGREDDSNFVDVAEETYLWPPLFWDRLGRAFRASPSLALPGSRTECAEALMKTAPFQCLLSDLTLGRVCNVVQLAIRRNMIGYSNGGLVPLNGGDSVKMVKESLARCRKPYNKTEGARIVDDFESLRACLLKITSDMRERRLPSSLPLSRIKVLIKEEFGLELHETRLGYSGLLRLLKDPWLQDICTVEMEGSVYALVPNAQSQTAAGRPFPALIARHIDTSNTFINVVGPESPAAATPGRGPRAARRSQSVPGSARLSLAERGHRRSSSWADWGCDSGEAGEDEEGPDVLRLWGIQQQCPAA